MPLIPRRSDDEKTTSRLIVRLSRANAKTLLSYADFIFEPDDIDYVLNQLIENVLAKDKDFVAWLKSQQEPDAVSVKKPRGKSRESATLSAA